MEESEPMEPANANHACARRIEDVWRNVCAGGLDSPHREDPPRKSSASRSWHSGLCSADGHRGEAFLELSRAREIHSRGASRGDDDQRRSRCDPWLEKILSTGKNMGARTTYSYLQRRFGPDHSLSCD